MFTIQHLRYYEKNIRVETLIRLRKTRNYEAESLVAWFLLESNTKFCAIFRRQVQKICQETAGRVPAAIR